MQINYEDDAKIVSIRKDGLWSYYSLNLSQCNKIILSLMNIFTESEDCICRSIDNKSM